MEASPLPASTTENWAEQFDQTLRAQRQRVREFLAAQQQRLRTAEDTLGCQLDHLARLLAEDREQTGRTRQDIELRREQLARETETLEAVRRELDQRRAEWDRLREQSDEQHRALAEQVAQSRQELERRGMELDRRREELDRDRAELDRRAEEIENRRSELDRRQPELEAAEARLEQDRAEFERKCRQLDADRQQLDALRQELDRRRDELTRRQEELSERESETESARRRIARELRDRHAAQLREVERRRAELEARDSAEQEDLRRRLQSAEERERDLGNELEQLRAAHARLREQLEEQASTGIDKGRLRALESERDTLVARLAEAEQGLARAQADQDESAAGVSRTDEEYRRRYELAVEDLRELKAENAELRERLTRSPSKGPQPASPPSIGGSTSWEAEKQRILAALEDDFDDEDEDDHRERMEIEEVIRRTDDLVAEKDREIAELRQLLEQQAGSVGELAVGAAALGEVIDADAVVQEERENLKRLQDEWREKLRQAEIDISVERAKLARERLQVEEKLRTLKSESDAAPPSPSTGQSPSKAPSGRWLQRLGLSSREEDSE